MGKNIFEKDLYEVLGVGKQSTASEIKNKYRSLARKLHPDKTKGDSVKEERFKAVSEAYEVLSDTKKRNEYDANHSLFEPGGSHVPQGKGSQSGDFGYTFGETDPHDIFANIFSAGAHRGSRKGQDLQTQVVISFRESISGTTLNFQLASDSGKVQNIATRIPSGVLDGESVRVKGKGSGGEAGPGDLIIQLYVKPHPIFSRKGENLVITLPVTFVEATLGADIKVPALSGDAITIRIAPGTPTGRTLRVKGRGVTKSGVTGDLLVTLEVQIPKRVEGEALEALKKFDKLTSGNGIREDVFTLSRI